MERIGRWLQPGPVWPDARLAPERFPRLRRLALAFALVGPARHRLRRRCSSFVRVWPFPPCAGERKHSQTLNFTGGNTLWLTKNPSLKSASVASRPRSGRTEPKSNRGTTSPSLVSTKTTLVNGRRRRASGATTCWCLPKWPIRSTRASSSFRRKKNSRPSPRGRGFRERRGWSSPFSDPSRFAPNPTSRLANCPPECGVPYPLRLSASPPSGLGNECRVVGHEDLLIYE